MRWRCKGDGMEKNVVLLKGRKRSAKRIALALAVMLVASACLALPVAYAQEGGSGVTTVEGLRSDLNDVNEQLGQAKNSYDSAVAELKVLEANIAELEGKIAEKEAEIEVTQGLIAENSAVLFRLLEQVLELEQEIGDQNSALNKRLRIMYSTSDQSILSVLLGSASFVDFLSNIEMVQKIHESDIAFLEELETKLNDVEAKKAEAEAIEATLKEQNAELEDQKEQLDADKAAEAAAKWRVQEIRDAAAAEIKQLEEESRRIEQELANMTSMWGDYAGGAMAWPVIGRATSEFGMRIHPITGRYAMHNGLDIAVPTGTAVHAAADGYVYFSGWNSGGYGNLVMIDNGSGIVTLYAHNSSLAVAAGNIVHRGDIIAYAGSTGNSTGPHCHFEVRVNGTPQNPRGWLG